MSRTNIALTDSGTTTARAALEYGTDTFARMSRPQLRRVYAAARDLASIEIEDYSNFMAYCKEINPTVLAAISESPVRPVSGNSLAVAHTYRLVSQLVSELCERDTSRIQASPTSREWSQTEGGYIAHHASDKTVNAIERIMAA